MFERRRRSATAITPRAGGRHAATWPRRNGVGGGIGRCSVHAARCGRSAGATVGPTRRGYDARAVRDSHPRSRPPRSLPCQPRRVTCTSRRLLARPASGRQGALEPTRRSRSARRAPSGFLPGGRCEAFLSGARRRQAAARARGSRHAAAAEAASPALRVASAAARRSAAARTTASAAARRRAAGFKAPARPVTRRACPAARGG